MTCYGIAFLMAYYFASWRTVVAFIVISALPLFLMMPFKYFVGQQSAKIIGYASAIIYLAVPIFLAYSCELAMDVPPRQEGDRVFDNDGEIRLLSLVISVVVPACLAGLFAIGLFIRHLSRQPKSPVSA